MSFFQSLRVLTGETLSMAEHGDTPQKVLCLLGSTGTGKSSLAAVLARYCAGAVVNCDSRQVYKRFPLITAQPGTTERALCQHWLYGFLETDEHLDAGTFTDLARDRADSISQSGQVPFLVGGTGLYLRSFLLGLAPIPEIPREVQEQIRAQCRFQGPESLHLELQAVDPEAARAIHPRDRQRVTRALEVYQGTGRPISWWRTREPRFRNRYQVLKVGLWMDLDSLTPRLKERIEQMLARGALEEAAAAWERCPDEQAPGWSAIGCVQVLQYLLGRWSLDQTRDEWLRKTRGYAKRQLTWFQKEPDVLWLAPGDQNQALEAVQGFLNNTKDEQLA